MNCLELRYNKGGETKIVKIINQSDTDQLSDWDLLFEFLTTGNLPQNVSVEGATRHELLQHLLNELENSKQPLHTYMLFDKSGGLQSKQDIINKIIGNKNIKDVLYDTYLDDMFTHNCLYVSGWGAKTWYGFTDQRPLMITGRPRLNQNMTEHTLFTSYYELRQGSQFVIDIVNKLFDKFSDYTSEDIYEKFTWLANNKLKETVDALYIPQYKIGVKNIHSELKKNIQQFIGYGIKYNGNIHIIKKRGKENNIIVTNIETNENIEIPISSVYNLYEQFTVHYKNNTFYLFNKQWYYKKNKKFVKCPEGASNELFNYFFGLNDDKFESINVYNKDLKVTLESKLSPSNITLQESLPVGSYVRTSSGYYIKDIDGTFKKGDEILESNTTIYKVFYPKNDIIDKIEREGILRNAPRNSEKQLFANISEELLKQISLVYERIPELAQIGTPVEYAAYLQSIFPNSKDKSIYWHGSDSDFSQGFNSAEKGKGSGSPHITGEFYLAKQAWTVLQYVSGINRIFGPDINGFNHWNKLWWELKEIMSNGRRHNNAWKDLVIGPENVRQGIPNKSGVFNRDSGGTNGKWLKERKADYGYQDKSDEEFFRDVFGIEYGKDTFNTWTQRNAEIFISLEKTSKGIYPAIINATNPIRESGQNTYYEPERGLLTQAKLNKNDAILGSNTDNEFNSDIAVVFNAAHNVHFLGTKQDVEAFKLWLQTNGVSKNYLNKNGTLTEDGKLIFSSSFDKSKFNSAITHVSLEPGVNGTELHIYGVSPKNGKLFEIVYHNNGNRYTFDLYIDGKTATDITNQNYINAINTYVPKEIYDLVVSGEFQKMDNTPTKLLDDGTDMIIERTELMDYFENNFNIYVSGRNSKFNISQLNKLVSLSDNNHTEEIKSLLPTKNSKYILTQQDALIILSELFNFDNNDADIWDHVKFSYDSENIKVRTINDEIILDIGLKDNSKDETNLSKMDSLRLAVALFKNLRSDNPISIPNGMNVLDFWYAIEKYKLGDEILTHRNKEYVLTAEQIESINLLKEIAGNSNENVNEWEDAVLRNREETMKSIHNESEAEWDAFINELINRGLYIMSCKL